MEMPFSLYHMYRLCVQARNVNFTFNKHLFTRCRPIWDYSPDKDLQNINKA